MLIDIGYEIELALSAPTALIHLLRVHPSRTQDLQMPEFASVQPPLASTEYADGFGNRCCRIQVPAGVGMVRLSSHSRICDSGLPDPYGHEARQHAPEELPTEVLQFLLPSRYCEVDSELLPFAWAQFGPAPLGWARVQAVCSFVHQRIRFDYAQARPNRSALEGFREQTGVCRDFAHLGVTFCRALNIPARLVVGYAIFDTPPPDFHAVFEAYLGGRWVLFDATHMSPIDDFVRIATGRDAKDVAFATIFGPATMLSMAPLIRKVA